MAVMASARVLREVILIPERTLRVMWLTKGVPDYRHGCMLTRLRIGWGESDQRGG